MRVEKVIKLIRGNEEDRLIGQERYCRKKRLP
jgi:hypothetical protein